LARFRERTLISPRAVITAIMKSTIAPSKTTSLFSVSLRSVSRHICISRSWQCQETFLNFFHCCGKAGIKQR
jgi:hypothetical protein